MAYSDFTLDDIKTQFQLSITEDKRLFTDVKPFDVPVPLLHVLESNVPLALAIDTEKARSEFIIAPILAEYRRIFRQRVSLFSGVDFSVDPQRGLNGTCDFILSRSPEQFYISAPIIMLVEAKNDRIKSGLPQCLSEMLAAQQFNTQKGNGIETVYGVVSTGSLWRFLQLAAQEGTIDREEYHVRDIQQIFGILASMIGE
jgi:hypothetical protein